ncbi:DUF501 domain-containing protein [Hydrogenothermus marinus]|uniref:DUF501 domain-containing protein n=1 Tax=Hydrogenothermus marinus TaxID=133270 RepID=A0A3M0BK66_9AQUI|nr:DUF501 domain-containing protein [Hydrogenothermus marinus]RMA97601.1 hypothetical protein CLV39_0220 [Hydrogenothermus marinus]
MIYDLGYIIYSRVNKQKQPNPTRYWLYDKKLDRLISKLEEKGEIKKISQIITEDEKIFNQMLNLHKKDIENRKRFVAENPDLPEVFKKALLDETVGIGGIKNYWEKPFKVKCLHLWTAYHLANKEFENFIGEYVLEKIKNLKD